jgi:di/tricarboxylate transporter
MSHRRAAPCAGVHVSDRLHLGCIQPIISADTHRCQIHRFFLVPGINTTVGTSTNLVITGQFTSRILDPDSEYYQPGASPITLFGLTPYGLPCTIFGIVYIVYAAPFLLTGGAGARTFHKYGRLFRGVRRRSPPDVDNAAGATVQLFPGAQSGADFFVGLLVTPGSPVVGKTVVDGGLRHLEGVYLSSVRRDGRIIHAVGSDFFIQAGDVLYFAGVPDGLDKLAAQMLLVPYSDAVETISAEQLPGLSTAFGVKAIEVPRTPSTVNETGVGTSTQRSVVEGLSDDEDASHRDDGQTTAVSPLELVQATIRKGASIVGKSIRDSAFRSTFHAAVVAIRRGGLPLSWTGEKIGDEVLHAGDELLLDVDPQFWTSYAINENFDNISRGGQVRTHHEFMVAMRVGRMLVGRTVQEAGLRQLPNAFLVAIERNGTTLHAVPPDETLQHNDVAWFAANAGSVRFLRNIPSLTPVAEKHARRLNQVSQIERRLVQAIVAPSSPLIHRTPAEVRFRQHFNAAVIAVARRGQRVRAKPGEIKLEAGDVLLLDAGPTFMEQNRDSKHFAVLIEMENSNPPRYLHTGICIALVITAFILYATEVLDILVGASVAAAAMLVTGCLSSEQARRAIKWDVYLAIAGSFGVSAALEQSGAAAAIANLIVNVGESAGGSGFTIAAVYVATTLLSQIISNNSAAALLFPIAATISKNDGVDIYLLSYAVMLGASSVFMSSFGYQTNLMALAAGGHSSRDFLKFGTPMQIVLAVVSIASLIAGSSGWPLVWLVTGIIGTVLLGVPQLLDILEKLKGRKSL